MKEPNKAPGKAEPQKLPQPTYWPFLMALGIVFSMWWIVSNWIFGVIGFCLFFISLWGWINELRAKKQEYDQ